MASRCNLGSRRLPFHNVTTEDLTGMDRLTANMSHFGKTGELTMPVDNPNVVDAVGIDKISGEVVLTISDHLEWSPCKEHLLLLQEKITRYLGFIESRELLEQYPKAEGKAVRIDVCCKYVPSKEAERFLLTASEAIRSAG